jgi:DNA ligase-associated metallophosphoesterase
MPTASHVLSPYICHAVAGEELLLLPEKAIYWPRKKIVLLADLHLGKAGHFRKAGIPVSAHVHRQDLQVLQNILQQWQVEEVIFLGDLFHSSLNSEWGLLESWMELQPEVQFTLIKGNHDILPETVYRHSKLRILEDKTVISPFLLTHHPPEAGCTDGPYYRLCGHVHPAIQLHGPGKQALTLPCFYFGLHCAILPAFGKFTGFHKIKPKAGEQVFGVLPERVLPLST